MKIAIRWFKQHAKELGVDPNRIVSGGSAAGTSACWAPRTDRKRAGRLGTDAVGRHIILEFNFFSHNYFASEG
ncbi:hypothetical protein N8622_02430 [bacterium]|nr:hypothetical protein [bacterium]